MKSKWIQILLSIVIIVSNFIWLQSSYSLMKHGYAIEYPKLYTKMLGGVGYSILFMIALSPAIQSVISLLRLSKLKDKVNSTKKLITSGILTGICIIASLIVSWGVFQLVPPVASSTTRITHYLVFGEDMNKYEKALKQFFPKVVPSDAAEIAYDYFKYNTILTTDVTISASWRLPAQSYEEAKQDFNHKAVLEALGENQYEVYVQGVTYPTDLSLSVTYNDELKRITYLATISDK